MEKTIPSGIPVVLATRCPGRGVRPIDADSGGGADLRTKENILAGRRAGPKARIKLTAALGATRHLKRIRDIFENNH